MLYKPKNIYPKINTDKPAIYLNNPDEINNETKYYNISFNANGTEKIKTVDCLLHSDGTVSLPYTTNFNDLPSFIYPVDYNLSLGRLQSPPKSFDIMCEGKIDYRYGEDFRVVEKPIYYLDESDDGGYSWCGSYDFKFCNITLKNRIIPAVYCNEIINSQYKLSNILSSQPEDIEWTPPTSWEVYCENNMICGKGNMLYGMMLNQTSLSDKTVDNLIIKKTDIVLNKSICQMSFSIEDTNAIKINKILDQYSYQSNPYLVLNETIPVYIKTKHICSITKITDLDDGKIQLDCNCTQSVIDEQLQGKDITNICVHRLNNIIITLEPMSNNLDQYKVISWEIPTNQGLTCSFLANALTELSYGSSYKRTWGGIEISKLTVDFSVIGTSPDNLIGAQIFDDFPSENVYYTYKIAEQYLSSFQGMVTYQLILNNNVYSDKTNVLIASSKPEINISLNKFSITTFHFTGTFVSSELKETIVSYTWKLYDVTNQLIYKTNKIYSQDFQFEYDNLVPGEYVIEAIVEDNYGQIWLKKEPFSVDEYEQDDLYLNFQSELEKENTGVKLKWDEPVYGETNIITNFTGYKMKRYNPLTQKVLNMGQYYFPTKIPDNIDKKVYAKLLRRFVDYSLPHNEEAKYLIYSQGNEIITDEAGNDTSQELIFSPIYSDLIKGDWDKWCLFTTRGPASKNLDGSADNGYNENVLLVDKVFFFEMNVETGSMRNNTDFSVVKNFTPYPTVQRSPSNYWSGQLKGLLGRLAIDDCTFKQTPTMLQEIKELTQNTSRKFLKDRDGNFWEVELSSDITIDNNDKLDVQLKTKSFNWVEVGDASDIALVSVGFGREDWLLTELGQEQIDISRYIWDDNAIWDDNDFWTESE